MKKTCRALTDNAVLVSYDIHGFALRHFFQGHYPDPKKNHLNSFSCCLIFPCFSHFFFFLLSFPVLTSLIKTKTKHRNGPLRGGWTRLKIETSRKSSSTNFSTKTSTCRDSQTGSWKPTRSTTKLKKTLRSHQSTSKAFIFITLAQVRIYFFFLRSLSLPRIWALFSLHKEQKN